MKLSNTNGCFLPLGNFVPPHFLKCGNLMMNSSPQQHENLHSAIDFDYFFSSRCHLQVMALLR